MWSNRIWVVTVPIKSTGFQLLAEWCLIPSLILTANISSQTSWALGPIIGKALGWAAILFASVIVISAFRGKLWPPVLITLIFVAKGFQIAFYVDGLGFWYVCYIVLYGCLLCSAAAVMISCRMDLVYKQLYIICLLSTVLMFLQVAGIADWSQFAATHFDSGVVTYPIAFFDETSFFDTTQRRPSGFMYSNQYLCIIILFGLVLHFSRKRGKLRFGTFVMCTMLVLSMAKLVFVGFILIVIFGIISGTNYQRRLILKGFSLAVLLFCLYKVIFPGLYESNMNADQLIFSFSTRISSILIKSDALDAYNMLNDLAIATRESGDMDIKVLQLNSATDMAQEKLSGYIGLIKILPYIVPSILIIMPFYLWGLRKLRAWFPDLTTLSGMSLIIVAIIPYLNTLFSHGILIDSY